MGLDKSEARLKRFFLDSGQISQKDGKKWDCDSLSSHSYGKGNRFERNQAYWLLTFGKLFWCHAQLCPHAR
jgi:uncharacterized membrane-anchored protein